MMDSSDSSDDDCSFTHWNHWTSEKRTTDKKESDNIYSEKNVPMNQSRTRMTSKLNDDKFGNWIPPGNWTTGTLKLVKKEDPREITAVREIEKEPFVPACSSLASLRSKTNNLNWDDRRDFTNLNNLSEKIKVWNIVDPGIFHKMNLWCNEYGYICGTAQGKSYSKRGCKDGVILVIDKPDVLRKVLGVSQPDWAMLCDSVKICKANLNYDAFNNYDILRMNSLERLWLLLCKRRQLLPSVCIQFCLNGAMKIMKEFQVLPKLVVQDVYDIQGKDM